MPEADTINGIHHLIDKEMVRHSAIKMKNGRAAESTGLLPEIVESAGQELTWEQTWNIR